MSGIWSGAIALRTRRPEPPCSPGAPNTLIGRCRKLLNTVSAGYFFRSTHAIESDAANSQAHRISRSGQSIELARQVRHISRSRGSILSIVVPAADDAIPDSGRVLVVDTESELRFALRTMFSAAGLIVDDADSLEAALHMLRTESFDLVLFDINMPGINGLESCQRIRAECSASIVMLDLRGNGSFDSGELRERIQSGLASTSCAATGPRHYRDPVVLRLMAAASDSRQGSGHEFRDKFIA
jgi:CheY-like chemotaxis protein